MPHMANLPWLETYVTVFIIYFFILCLLKFNKPMFMKSSDKIKTNFKTNWKW